ncbi:site-specific integrase, partial [Mycobacterium palustre]|uniref:site-specific integrase n=1 Tax=Mycobacterium palustre TaxID=153971 RepID=UPI0021F2C5B9
MDAILAEFDQYLDLQCARSAHTRRAYLGDLRSLAEFLNSRGVGLDGLSLPVLRAWLSTAAGAGAARTTLARRTSALSLPVLRAWLSTAAGAGAARTTLARRTSA